MKNQLPRINVEWPPDRILAALLPKGLPIVQDEYQRALWIWRRKPRRFFFHPFRPWRTVTLLLPALIINVTTFLWSDSPVRSGIMTVSFAADGLVIIWAIGSLIESCRWYRWLADYSRSINRLLREPE